jgi:hypothetical protein
MATENESEKETTPQAPAKAPGQIAAERAESGEAVPPEEQGKPTEAREWLATERERQEKIDTEKFKAEYAAARAAQTK